MIQIIEMVEAPVELKELVRREANGVSTIESVVFGAFMQHMEGTVGTYSPKMKTIYIDVGNALTNQSLYKRGMMFIPGIWCTLIWAIGHEVQHALQLEVEPRLIEFDALPQEYEDGAMDYGEELLKNWMNFNKIPPIDQMGWLGKQLVVLLNTMYSKHPEVAEEIDLLKHGAVASLEAVFAIWDLTDKEKEVMRKDVDNEKIGVKVGEARYLKASEFLGI